jgi:dehydrogenase/reductase SDR family member 7B
MFDGQICWITGASSGIGAALARQFAKRGARLILSGRDEAALARVASECGGEPMILPFETTDYAAIPALVEKVLSLGGRIDILVNNAGISQRSLARETDFSVYERIIAVDLLAPIALTQAALPHMLAQESGRILMISSVAGKVGVPLRTGYSAAKHGLIGYADALRAETEALGLHVHVITPGSIRTDVSRNALEADGSRRGVSDPAIERGIDPDHAANLMLRAVERGEREIVIARGVERKMPGLRRLAPNRLFDMMAGMMAQGYAERMKRDG